LAKLGNSLRNGCEHPMTKEPGDIVLRCLRRIDEKLEILVADVQDLKLRATNAEEALAGVNRRLDRADERVMRIEKRLELVDV
jgi:hypothetical protein